jgi:hypothetical protein
MFWGDAQIKIKLPPDVLTEGLHVVLQEQDGRAVYRTRRSKALWFQPATFSSAPEHKRSVTFLSPAPKTRVLPLPPVPRRKVRAGHGHALQP